MRTHLMWFRRDLRVNDNTALHFACKNINIPIFSVFISTPYQWTLHNQSPKQTLYIYKNLLSLKKKLSKLNIPLFYLQATDFLNSIQKILDFCLLHQIDHVYYNYEYGLNEQKRDDDFLKIFLKNHITTHGFYDNLLISPSDIKNNTNQPYKKFHFFKKKIAQKLNFKNIICYSKPLLRKPLNYNFYKKIPLFQCSYEKFDENIFPIGENKIYSRFKNFCKTYHIHSKNSFTMKYSPKNSFLSPALNVGIISVRRCVLIFLKKNICINTTEKIINNNWINEIIWREFFYHLMYAYPILSKYKTLSRIESFIPWKKNKLLFKKWKNGKTGYPIIDAAMRQLNQLGWINNRLRMIVSSFFTKNLFLNWRLGEKYFMSKLIDGNLAINNGCWQWIASIGTENMPFYRKFNFIIQSQKIDPNGSFIKKMIPELKSIPKKYIHFPFNKFQNNLFYLNYFSPIINMNESFNKSKLIFKKIYKYIKNNRVF